MKRLGYGDHDIILVIKDCICEYFNYQISTEIIDKMIIYRLDLAKYFIIESNTIMSVLFDTFSLSKYQDSFNMVNIEQNSIYLNPNQDTRSTIVYNPKRKENNPIKDNRNLIKLEQRRTYNSQYDKKSSIDMTFKELEDLTRKDLINDLYEEWLRYEFPYTNLKKVMLNLHKNKKNIHNIEQLKDYILKNRPKPELKFIYFALFLSFLDEKSYRDVMNIFININYYTSKSRKQLNPFYTIVETMRKFISRMRNQGEISLQS